MADAHKGERLLPVIGVFKLLKAAGLILVAIGTHKLLGRNIGEVVEHWVGKIRIDPDSRYAHAFIAKVTGLSPRQLKALSIGTLIYGAVYAVEGVGLILRKRWAEYITVGTTITFLPFEIYEIIKKPDAIRIGLLVANVLVLVYLVVALRRKSK